MRARIAAMWPTSPNRSLSFVRYAPDANKRAGSSRRLQLAPGLERPTSWNLSPCPGPSSIYALMVVTRQEGRASSSQRGPLSPEPKVRSNQLCRISIRVSTAKRIAAKSIHRFRWSQLTGRQAVSSIGGFASGESGGVACAGRTAANGGSGQLIFVLQAAHSHDSNASPCHLARDLSTRSSKTLRRLHVARR
jgi:hypothetical protein